MKKYGYRQGNADHTLFIKRMGGKVTLLIIYVDDMVVTGDDTEEIKRLQGYLSSEFEMKDLGGLKYFLGIEVARSRDGIYLSQRKYVLDILSETGMLACKLVETPIVQNHHLAIYQDQVPTNKERYQRLVGRLIYLSLTRPDIAYAVSIVSQFMHAPSEDHMAAVMRILSYLKGAPSRGLIFRKHGHMEVKGYTDADWAGNIIDRRSTSGYFTFVAGNLGSMSLYCENQAAREIANNPVQHDRTKHVEVDRHFIKEKLDVKLIDIPYVRSEEQLADVLTHAVSARVFQDSLDKLGLGDIYAPT
ncbi:unnamed protein product [Malus baccata var. baccata]